MTAHDGVTEITPYIYVAGDFGGRWRLRWSLVVICACSSFFLAVTLKKSFYSCKVYSAFFFISSGGLLPAVSIFLSRRFGGGRGKVIGLSGACSRG
jgi:hypothetical protein